MFVIVDMSDNTNRLFEKHRKHPVSVNRVDVMGCAPFFTAKAHCKYTNTADLEKVIRRYGCAIFSSGNVPLELKSLCFTPQVLPLKMLVKTAARYFMNADSTAKKATVTVFDPSAKACDEVSRLCTSVRYVRVVTKKTAVYEKLSNEVFNECGAVLCVTENPQTAQGSDLVIALNSKMIDSVEFKNAVVYKKTTPRRGVTELSKCRIKHLLPACAKGFDDDFLILSALYETCGYKIDNIPVFSGSENVFFGFFV